MARQARIVIVGVAVLVLVGVGVVMARTREGGPSFRPRAAPAWTLPDLARPDATVSLAAFRGRPVVLNLWATWCVPCRKEMPALAAANRRYGSRVEFVGVDHEDSRRLALQFVKRTGVAYPSAYDAKGVVGDRYGAYGLPTTFFISPTGTIVAQHTGRLRPEDIERYIQRLLRAS